MPPVVKIEGLSKRYMIGRQPKERYVAIRDVVTRRVKDGLNRLLRPGAARSAAPEAGKEEFWALKDVSFEIEKGDKLGVIGKNGAGKSTLLKVLSRITEPTRGRISIKGRISSLLEVGTGFHPELTGRENIFLNGAILGMKRPEVLRKFDEIVDFAEVEQFLDTPVKHFSSGMYVRLAFAVAAHLEPEILIVDEVLSVGDLAFQKKCLGKLKAAGQDGRTVIFVSHHLESIMSLCNRGIVLEKGSVSYQGDAAGAVAHYTRRTLVEDRQEAAPLRQDADSVQFVSGRVLDAQGAPVLSVGLDQAFAVEMKFSVGSGVKGVPVPNFHFKTADGTYAFCVNAPGMKKLEAGTYASVCQIPGNLVNNGMYTIGLAVTEYTANALKVHFFKENHLSLITVEALFENPARYGYGGQIPGVLRPEFQWKLTRVNP